jgi:single-strand DNA-binding protein
MVSATIIGNLGSEPSVRKTGSGTEIVELRIASQDGKDKTSWWTAKFFGNKAGETALKFAKKGSSVVVVGKVEIEEWGEGDAKKSKPVIIGSHFEFGPSRPDGEKSNSKPAKKEEDGDQSSDSVPF